MPPGPWCASLWPSGFGFTIVRVCQELRSVYRFHHERAGIAQRELTLSGSGYPHSLSPQTPLALPVLGAVALVGMIFGLAPPG